MKNILALSRRTAGFLMMTLLAVMALAAPALAGEADYDKLVAQVKSGQKDVDYGALREAYVKSPGYDPYSSKIIPLVEEMRQAARQSDFETTLARAKSIIDANFILIDAHLYAAVCHDRLGHAEEAKREREIGHGLVKAIMQTGDGKSPETAFVVVTVAEEYSMLLIMKARMVQQKLISQGGHSYDQLDIAPLPASTGAPGNSAPDMVASMYFQVDTILAKTNRELFPKGGANSGSPK